MTSHYSIAVVCFVTGKVFYQRLQTFTLIFFTEKKF